MVNGNKPPIYVATFIQTTAGAHGTRFLLNRCLAMTAVHTFLCQQFRLSWWSAENAGILKESFTCSVPLQEISFIQIMPASGIKVLAPAQYYIALQQMATVRGSFDYELAEILHVPNDQVVSVPTRL